MVNNKHAFWKALIFAVIVFAIGFFLGFFLENSRTSQIELNILNSEINLLDEQIRSRGIEQFEIDCAQAKQSTFEFADKIYDEVIQLEVYDSNSKFIGTLKILHKRYDLLRTILWTEGIQIKKECNTDFHTLVYFFEYGTENTQTQAKQASLSRLLADVKNKYGDKILLIPIAGNLDLESINLIKKKYGISGMPSIIADENKVISTDITFEDLEKIIFEHQGYAELEGKAFRRVDFNAKNRIFLN